MDTKTLRVGILAPILSLDPARTGDLVAALALSQIFETPLRLAGPGERPVPILFDGLESEEEGRIWFGHVREGILFSDGTPLDASRLVRSLRRVESVRQAADIEARGSLVHFRLHEPNTRFDLQLTFDDCGVALETENGLLGTGPFRPVGKPTPRGLRLERNERYRAEVGPEAVEFRVYPPDDAGHPEALLAALAEGEVDFTNMLSKQDVTAVSGFKKVLRPSMSLAILFCNTRRALLEDSRRRQAIAHALDRRALTAISHSNVVAFSATSVLPPSLGIGDDGLNFDADRARELLAESGEIRGPLDLVVVWAPRPYIPHPLPVAEKVAEQLRQVGIEVRITVPESAEDYFELQRAGRYDLLLGGWIADVPDAAELLTALFAEDRIPTPAAMGIASGNLARWRDEPAARLLESYRTSGDDADRDQLLQRVAEEVPLIPLMYGSTAIVHAWRVRNVVIAADGQVPFADVELDP